MARQSVYMHVLLSEVDNGGEFFAKIPVVSGTSLINSALAAVAHTDHN